MCADSPASGARFVGTLFVIRLIAILLKQGYCTRLEF
jgi:hypothetical protein